MTALKLELAFISSLCEILMKLFDGITFNE